MVFGGFRWDYAVSNPTRSGGFTVVFLSVFLSRLCFFRSVSYNKSSSLITTKIMKRRFVSSIFVLPIAVYTSIWSFDRAKLLWINQISSHIFWFCWISVFDDLVYWMGWSPCFWIPSSPVKNNQKIDVWAFSDVNCVHRYRSCWRQRMTGNSIVSLATCLHHVSLLLTRQMRKSNPSFSCCNRLGFKHWACNLFVFSWFFRNQVL